MDLTDKDILDSAVIITKSLIESRCINETNACDHLKECFDNIKEHANGTSKNKEKLVPAVAIKKSITPDFLICLEDGKQFKSLKRHLRTSYNLSPDEYREKWSLPHDYPMVAPTYRETRSKLAKKMKLGQRPESGIPAPSKKSKGSKRPNGTSTRMGGAERGDNPAPS